MSNSETTASPFPWITIEEIAALRSGAIKIGPFGSQLKKEELSKQGYKVYGQENVIAGDFSIGDRYVGTSKFAQLQSCRLFPDDVVLTMMGTIGHCAIFPADAEVGIMDSHLLRIQVNREIAHPDFIALVIGSKDVVGRQITRMSHGSIMSGLSSKIVRRLRVPLPPLREQRRIAAILDTADEAIRQAERVIAKLKAVKAGLLQDLLTRGLDEHGHLRDPQAHPEQFKDSPLGRIPREWEISTLGSCVEFVTDYRGKTPPYTDEGIPAISAENVGNGCIKSITKYVTPEVYKRWLTRGHPLPDDVIITTEAPVGEVALVPSDQTYLLTRRLMALRPNVDVLRKRFLYWYLFRMKQIEAWDAFTHGSTVPRILKPDILDRSIPLPPPHEQDSIVEFLDTHDARIRAEEAELAKLRQVKRGLMDDLLTGRVRVA